MTEYATMLFIHFDRNNTLVKTRISNFPYLRLEESKRNKSRLFCAIEIPSSSIEINLFAQRAQEIQNFLTINNDGLKALKEADSQIEMTIDVGHFLDSDTFVKTYSLPVQLIEKLAAHSIGIDISVYRSEGD